VGASLLAIQGLVVHMPSLAGKLLRQTASIALETKSPLAIAAGLLWEPACWRFRACGPHAIACRQAPTADSIHRFGNKEPAGDSCRSFVGASLLAIQGLVVRMPSLAGKLLQQTAFIALETKSLLKIAAGLL